MPDSKQFILVAVMPLVIESKKGVISLKYDYFQAQRPQEPLILCLVYRHTSPTAHVTKSSYENLLVKLQKTATACDTDDRHAHAGNGR